MSALYRPRRWPPDPNDPEQQQDDPSLYGPNLGPAGGPAAPPPPTPTPVARPAAAEASMYQPNPTGPMPTLGDPMEQAKQTLYAPAQEQQVAPERAAMTAPEPPRRVPYPEYNPFSLGHANAYARANVDAENAHNDKIYENRLRAYEAEQRRITEAGYARNLGANAPAESQLMAKILDPNTSPAEKAALTEQLNQSRKFNTPDKMPNEDQLYADALANPGKYPNEQDILRRHEEGRKYAFPEQRGFAPIPMFAPDGTPGWADPNARQFSFPGYQPPQQQTTPNFSNVAGGGSSTAPTTGIRSAPPQAPPAMAQPAPRPAGALPPGPYTKGGGAGAMRTSPEQLRELAHAIAPMDVHSLSKASDVASRYGSDRAMLFNLARQENPQFDWATVERRRKMLDDFQNGKSGVNLQSLDTFLGHAGDLAEVIRATPQSSVPLLNKSYNWWRTNMSGDPQFARLKAAIAPVGREFMNFILNNKALYEIDKEDAQTILNGEMPLNMMLATLEQMGQTVDVRYGSMDARFRSNMGAGFGEAFPDQFSKRGIEGAHKLGIDLKAPGGGSAGAAGHVGAPSPAGGTSKLTNFHVNPKTGERIGYDPERKTWVPAPQ